MIPKNPETSETRFQNLFLKEGSPIIYKPNWSHPTPLVCSATKKALVTPIRGKCLQEVCVFNWDSNHPVTVYSCSHGHHTDYAEMSIDKALLVVVTKLRQQGAIDQDLLKLKISTDYSGKLRGTIENNKRVLVSTINQYTDERVKLEENESAHKGELRNIYYKQCYKFVQAKVLMKAISRKLNEEIKVMEGEVKLKETVEKLADAFKNLKQQYRNKPCFAYHKGCLFISHQTLDYEYQMYKILGWSDDLMTLRGAGWFFYSDPQTKIDYIYCVGGITKLGRDDKSMHCIKLDYNNKSASLDPNRSWRADEFYIINPAVVIYTKKDIHKVFIIGGLRGPEGNDTSDEIYEIQNLKNKQIASKVKMPKKLCNHSAVLLHNDVYIAGGIDIKNPEDFKKQHPLKCDMDLSRVNPNFANKEVIKFDLNQTPITPLIIAGSQSGPSMTIDQRILYRSVLYLMNVQVSDTEREKRLILFGGNNNDGELQDRKALGVSLLESNNSIKTGPWMDFSENTLPIHVTTTGSKKLLPELDDSMNIVDFQGKQFENSTKFMHVRTDPTTKQPKVTVFYLTSKGARQGYIWRDGNKQ